MGEAETDMVRSKTSRRPRVRFPLIRCSGGFDWLMTKLNVREGEPVGSAHSHDEPAKAISVLFCVQVTKTFLNKIPQNFHVETTPGRMEVLKQHCNGRATEAPQLAHRYAEG